MVKIIIKIYMDLTCCCKIVMYLLNCKHIFLHCVNPAARYDEAQAQVCEVFEIKIMVNCNNLLGI